MTQSVYHMFNEYDTEKSGFVSFYDFKDALEQKLRAFDVKQIDMLFLAKKYQPSDKRVAPGMI